MDGVPAKLRHPLEPSSEIEIPGEILGRLPEWRRSWDEIWYVRLDGEDFVWRSPTRQEAIQYDLNAQSTLASAIDQLLGSCVLWPEALADNMPAHRFLKLHDLVWQASGFRDAEFFLETLSNYEEIVRSGDQVNLLVLMKAFPGLLPDVINSWQPEKLIYHIALARALLDIEPLHTDALRRRHADKVAHQRNVRPEPGNARSPQPPRGPSQSTYNWEKDLREWEAFERS